MLDRYDQHDLLALIEDDLSPAKQAAVNAMLRDDPVARAQLELLRADRRALQSLDEPAPPADLLEDLDLWLAGESVEDLPPAPMVETHRRRRTILRPWMAVAALLVMTISIGLVMLQTYDQSRQFETPDQPPANKDATAVPAEKTASGDALASAAEQSGSVHHYQPLSPPADQSRSDVMADQLDSDMNRTDSVAVASPEFVLFIDSENPNAVAADLAAAISPRQTNASLVRNFSYDDAAKISEAQMLAGKAPHSTREKKPLEAAGAERARERSSKSFAVGSVLSSDSDIADRAARRREAKQLHQQGAADELIVGSRRLVPPAQTQLELSDSGAEFTMTIAAEDFPAVLAELSQRNDGYTLELRRLSGESKGQTLNTPADIWRLWAQWREKEHAGTLSDYLQLPVIVQSK